MNFEGLTLPHLLLYIFTHITFQLSMDVFEISEKV